MSIGSLDRCCQADEGRTDLPKAGRGVVVVGRLVASMAATEVNDRWQAEMAALIDPLTDPATGFHQRLEEVFHLD
jgi:hypothetical protein